MIYGMLGCLSYCGNIWCKILTDLCQRPAQLHSATAQQSPQGSSMKGLCAVVGIGTTAVLYIVLTKLLQTFKKSSFYMGQI